MPDAWDDSGDEWDADSDDDQIASRLANLNTGPAKKAQVEEEEDLAVIEKAADEKREKALLRNKGIALAAKKAAAKAIKDEEEIMRKSLEYEANMNEDERRLLQKQRGDEADFALVDELFGGDGGNPADNRPDAGGALVLKNMKDHLLHAKAIGKCVREHGKAHLALALIREILTESKDVLDDDSLTDLGKSLNVIKNTKIAEKKKLEKKKAAAKPKKDKGADKKAKAAELFGDNDLYDDYDDYGAQYEDDFF